MCRCWKKSPNENVIYVGPFDNIPFTAPEPLAPGETTSAIYTSIPWVGAGKLQRADTVPSITWTDVTNARSPAAVLNAGRGIAFAVCTDKRKQPRMTHSLDFGRHLSRAKPLP